MQDHTAHFISVEQPL